ncbi:MAG: OmpH family outer membrane protein [Rhodospirillales bacterium]|nr:OmpH family outer membrane protein [Rhodospirillales bacterium]
MADVILVLQEAAAAQSIRTQLEKRRTTYQGEVQKEENDLRNAEQELARQRTILSPEAFAQKRREFEKRVADAQQNAQNRRRILDQAFGDAMQNVQQAMFDVIGDILLEQKYQVVLPKAQVVVMQTSLDITPEVLRRLNKKMPTVTVTFPPK